MEKYYYLLSYVRESKYGSQMIYASIVNRDKPILTAKDVDEAAELLRKDFGDNSRIIILSFSKLEGVE